ETGDGAGAGPMIGSAVSSKIPEADLTGPGIARGQHATVGAEVQAAGALEQSEVARHFGGLLEVVDARAPPAGDGEVGAARVEGGGATLAVGVRRRLQPLAGRHVPDVERSVEAAAQGGAALRRERHRADAAVMGARLPDPCMPGEIDERHAAVA